MSYQKMYTLLFNAITDALQDLSAGAVQQAMVQLAAAQQQAEELYLSDTQNRERPCCAGLLSILVFQQFPSGAPVGEIALHLRVERRRVVVVPDVGQLMDHHVLDGRRRIGHQVQ